MAFLKNVVSGYLGAKANQKIGGIKNPFARRIAGNLLGASPLGDLIPGLRNPPRNPDQNLLFGARMLSELQLRGELQQQSEQFGVLKAETTGKVQENYDWRARLRPKRGGEAYVYGQVNAKTGERILYRIKEKLNGVEDGVVLSVEGHVSYLIQEAQSKDNLALLYEGWQAWV